MDNDLVNILDFMRLKYLKWEKLLSSEAIMTLHHSCIQFYQMVKESQNMFRFQNMQTCTWGVRPILLTTVTSGSGKYYIYVVSNINGLLIQAVPNSVVVSLRLKLLLLFIVIDKCII
jgi:hypothetical protein